MPPFRMNLTTLKIAPAKAAADVAMDTVFKAPRSDLVETATVTVRAQVYYNAFNTLSPSKGGDRDMSFGHITFSASYLRKIAFMPKVGDRVTSVIDYGSTFRAVNFRIVQVQPSGHLPHPELVVAFFEHDRESRAT